jgi:HlyD family secretion protein
MSALNPWRGFSAVVLAVLLISPWGNAPAAEARGEAAKPLIFRTAPVTRGDLVATVRAAGTLEPQEVVDVGPQVAGAIQRLGPDPRAATDPRYRDKPIDYGSPVEEGTLLAQIDDRAYLAQVEQARAACTRAEAELAIAKVKLELAESELQRARELAKNKAAPSSEFDVAKANCKAAQAGVIAAEATLVQNQAALKLADLNLSYTRIQSPVKGVIIARRVNVGQTVMANLHAPSLFLIAKDLKKLQVWASVNEADIGSVHAGQPARFTVDAYPDDVFRGKVEQVRLNAAMSQNVVTYTVVVEAENPAGKLLPYLTANVQFEVERRKDVLTVPNAALRWRPQPEEIAPDVREKAAPSQERPGGHEGRTDERPRRHSGQVWVPDGTRVRPVQVQIGLTDATRTEVSGPGLQEGLGVIIGQGRRASGDVDAANPFAPRPSREKEHSKQ